MISELLLGVYDDDDDDEDDDDDDNNSLMCLPAKTTAVPTMPVRSPDTVICPGS